MSSQLPPEVVEALRRGSPLEAMKLMRKANPKMGLAEAKKFLEAVQRMVPTAAAQVKGQAQAHVGSSTPHTPPQKVAVHQYKQAVRTTFERTGLSPGEEPKADSDWGPISLLVVGVMALLLYVKFG